MASSLPVGLDFKLNVAEPSTRCAPSRDQCDISTGTVIDSNMPCVTPPRILSFNRE
jgi:hypothetical protein